MDAISDTRPAYEERIKQTSGSALRQTRGQVAKIGLGSETRQPPVPSLCLLSDPHFKGQADTSYRVPNNRETRPCSHQGTGMSYVTCRVSLVTAASKPQVGYNSPTSSESRLPVVSSHIRDLRPSPTHSVNFFSSAHLWSAMSPSAVTLPEAVVPFLATLLTRDHPLVPGGKSSAQYASQGRFNYAPSLAAAVIFLVFYALIVLANWFLLFRHRAWFWWSMNLAVSSELFYFIGPPCPRSPRPHLRLSRH